MNRIQSLKDERAALIRAGVRRNDRRIQMLDAQIKNAESSQISVDRASKAQAAFDASNSPVEPAQVKHEYDYQHDGKGKPTETVVRQWIYEKNVGQQMTGFQLQEIRKLELADEQSLRDLVNGSQ